MWHFSRRFSWWIFTLAAITLIAIAFGADKATSLYSVSEQQVAHTYDVKSSLEGMQSNLAGAQAAAFSYILNGYPASLADFARAKKEVPASFAQLSRLTADNPSQQQRLANLKPLLDQRFATLTQAIELHEGARGKIQEQVALIASGEASNSEIHASLLSMENEEDRLLAERREISDLRYRRVRTVLLAAFCATLLLLFVNFQRLLIELKNRERAEEVVRRLSGRILSIQDEERRRISRELHDSVGQLFAALKLNLGRLEPDPSALNGEKANIVAECFQLLDQGMAEVRTLSHLLHPPLLDELGFASAAEWFVSGFSKRSNLQVKLELPPQLPRMPHAVELTLFRVLQEGLTNVHRHAHSNSVEIRLECSGSLVTLSVLDDGTGIPSDLLESFNKTGTESGVGLAGMRERMIDLGGKLEISSSEQGTLLQVTVPLRKEEESVSAASGSPQSAGQKEQDEASGQPAMDPPGSSLRSPLPSKSRA